MNVEELIRESSDTRKPRTSIYLAADKVESLFEQSVSAVSELVQSNSLGLKASAGLASLFSGGVETGRDVRTSIDLTPLLKAFLIEKSAARTGDLIDMSKRRAEAGSYLTITADARLFDQEDDISAPELSASAAARIQEERAKQLKYLKKQGNDIEALVWVCVIGDRTLASVLSSKWINWGYYASYRGQQPQGILGRSETLAGDVEFISPIWIWA